MAQQSDFLYVGQPHDPYSISGSDPYNHFRGVYGENANLSCWYNCDPGWVITGSDPVGVNHKGDSDLYGAANVQAMIDRSGNNIGSAYSGTENKRPTFKNINGLRNLKRQNAYVPQLSSSNLPLDEHKYITNRDDNTDGMMLSTREWNDNYNYFPDADTADWITIADGMVSNVPKSHSIFISSQFASKDEDQGRSLGWVYGGSNRNSTGYPERAYDTMGPFYHLHTTMQNYYLAYKRSGNSTAVLAGGNSTRQYFGHTHFGWHAHGFVYFSGSDHANMQNYLPVSMSQDGDVVFNGDCHDNTNYKPYMYTAKRCVQIGGSSGYHGGTDNIAQSVQGFMDFFVFENALSPTRRQQMERFLCDKTGLKMRDTWWLSEFYGGPQGAPHLHSSLTVSGASHASTGSYCRKYMQEPTASGHPKIHYETAAGAFLKKSVSGSVYQSIGSGKSLSLRAWVRTTGDTGNADIHKGSHFALVAKATSPFGHQVDNIKGYALKFGTFNNGAYGALKIRLSTRNAEHWSDGATSGTGSCADETYSYSCSKDQWYQLRLDVHSQDHTQDTVKTYVRSGSQDAWTLLGTKTLNQAHENYRLNTDVPEFDDTRVPVPNGRYNGYWVAMSSSSGQQLSTKYFVDDFEIMTDS